MFSGTSGCHFKNMKINERNLISFAAAHTPVDREGWLETRSDPTRPYTRRWFVLKGNLLFSFDKRGDREPVALLILEGCTIGKYYILNKVSGLSVCHTLTKLLNGF